MCLQRPSKLHSELCRYSISAKTKHCRKFLAIHRWSCSSTPPISGDARLNVFVGLVATYRFRSSGDIRYFGPQSACVNKPGTILAGPFLCRIEIIDMAMTSHLIGGYLSEKNNGKSMAI